MGDLPSFASLYLSDDTQITLDGSGHVCRALSNISDFSFASLQSRLRCRCLCDTSKDHRCTPPPVNRRERTVPIDSWKEVTAANPSILKSGAMNGLLSIYFHVDGEPREIVGVESSIESQVQS